MMCGDYAEFLEGASIGALDRDDAVALRHHLNECSDCSRQLAILRDVAWQLADSIPMIEPSSDLKAKVLASLDTRPLRAVDRRPAKAVGGSSRLVGRLGFLAVAASVILAVGTGYWARGVSRDLEEERRLNQILIGEVQGKEDLVQLISSRVELLAILSGTPQAPFVRGRIYAASTSNTALLVVDNLAPLPPERIYQVWVMQAGERLDAGSFTVDPDGHGKWLIYAPDSISHYQALVITEEPAGGSRQPTTARIAVAIF